MGLLIFGVALFTVWGVGVINFFPSNITAALGALPLMAGVTGAVYEIFTNKLRTKESVAFLCFFIVSILLGLGLIAIGKGWV